MFSYRDHKQFEGILQFRGGKHVLSQMRSEYCRWWQNKQVRSEYCCWWQNVTQVKVITIVKPVSNTILLVKTMLIRPCQYIHTALLIYPYGPRKIFIRPCHTDQLDYLIKVLRTGCFCIGPAAGIDSRSAVLANTANLESIPGPIQKQPVSNTIIFRRRIKMSILIISFIY